MHYSSTLLLFASFSALAAATDWENCPTWDWFCLSVREPRSNIPTRGALFGRAASTVSSTISAHSTTTATATVGWWDHVCPALGWYCNSIKVPRSSIPTRGALFGRAASTVSSTISAHSTTTATATVTATPTPEVIEVDSDVVSNVIDMILDGVYVDDDLLDSARELLDKADLPGIEDLADLVDNLEVELKVKTDKRDESSASETENTDDLDNILRGLGLIMFDALFPGNATETATAAGPAVTEALKQRRSPLARRAEMLHTQEVNGTVYEAKLDDGITRTFTELNIPTITNAPGTVWELTFNGDEEHTFFEPAVPTVTRGPAPTPTPPPCPGPDPGLKMPGMSLQESYDEILTQLSQILFDRIIARGGTVEDAAARVNIAMADWEEITELA